MTWPLTCSLPCFFSAKSTKISLSLFQLSAFLLVTRYKRPASCLSSRSLRAQRKIHLYPDGFLLSPLLPPSNSKSSIQPPNFDLQLLIAYTSLTQEILDYEIQVIREFVRLKNPVD